MSKRASTLSLRPKIVHPSQTISTLGSCPCRDGRDQYVSPKSPSFLPPDVPGRPIDSRDGGKPVLGCRPELCRRTPGIGIVLPGTGIPVIPVFISIFEYVPRRLGVLNSPSNSSSMRLMLAERPCIGPLIDDRGRPSGVRVPDMDVRDTGRGGAIMSFLDAGLAYEEMLALELGRLMSESGPRFGSGPGPKERRLIPDVLSRGTWLLDIEARGLKLVGVASSPSTDEEAEDPAVRFRDRIVTDAGTLDAALIDRGEARGGVVAGAGSLDRTECTLASRRCICAVSERMWESELEAGSL